MARKPRGAFPGAFYPVICRGNQRHAIFHDDADWVAHIDLLEPCRKCYGFALYADALMSHDVHLLIETTRPLLSKLMQGLQFPYTQYAKRRYHPVGHLFHTRYSGSSPPIQSARSQ